MDPTIPPALNDIATQQYAPITETIDKANILMDYAHTYPNSTIRYYASDMCLHIESSATYLVQSNTFSRVAGHFYIIQTKSSSTATPYPTPNGLILIEYKPIKRVMSSAAKVEKLDIPQL